MSSFVRRLLIWLLALALPAQGIAAATMQFCGPGHQPQVRQLESGAHEHHGAHGHAAALAADGAGKHQGANLAQLGKLKCSVCAACCMATALPASPLTLPVVEPVVERTAFMPARYVGPEGAGLERPPRLALA